MRVVVASYYDEIFVPIVSDICARSGWTVCDWFSAYASRNPAVSPESSFPGAVVHRPEFAARGLLPPEMNATPEPALDQEILAKMAPYEAMFMRMLDIYDPDGHSFSGRERRFAYFDLLRMALRVVKAHRPGLFIAGTIPHALHDYMLYCVCKTLGIDTLIYRTISVPGYMMLHSSLEEGSARLATAYQTRLSSYDGGPVALPIDFDAYLDRVRRDYAEGEPWYSRLRDRSMLAQRDTLPWLPDPRRMVRKLRSTARLAVNLLRSPRRAYEEQFVRPMTDIMKRRAIPLRDTVTTQHEVSRIFDAGLQTKRRLLAQYRKLERVPDLGANFVYLPLHYQPEASTSPLGGAFLDQLLMIRLLARHLPESWKIYVKEQRSIFDPQLRGHFARDLNYYTEILDVPAATLVPMEIPSFELIDRARAVAIVTGTAGWEAVVRGVPALVFGNAWYKDCEGVFDARSDAGCANAMSEVAGGFRPDLKRVRLFLQAVAEVALHADRDNTYILTDLTPQQSRAATVEHFLREYPLMT